MKNIKKLSSWLLNQKRSLLFAYQELTNNLITSIITIAIIAMAVTLPLLFHIALKNLNLLNQHWQSKAPTISLYLRTNLSNAEIDKFVGQLKNNPHIAQTKYISSEAALTAFKKNTQLGSITSLFKKNPLPATLVILPKVEYQSPTKISLLFNEIKNAPLVDTAQLDMNWIKRLYALIRVGNRITHLLTLFFAIGVLLIISNALRTITLKHEQEIEIMQLMGATDSFIRTPLLYCGILYALIGSMVATCVTNFFIWMLQGPALDFARTYQAQINLIDLSFGDSVRVICYCLVISFFGGYFITQRLLNKKQAN